MIYRILTDLLVAFHLGFVFFVCLGGLFVLRWPRMIWLHLPAAIWGAIVEWTQTVCPLTTLENHLRHLRGQAGYINGFIEYHITRVLYPDGLTKSMQIALGVFVVLLNAGGYVVVFWLRRRRPRAGSKIDKTI
ncbi:MAG TPA: DUF2784 domain-containing protein [Thermoanaerobaculia bacterium]|nr:DUF2784 domain-containing protein [Thermoanaerobaculia bacterium]